MEEGKKNAGAGRTLWNASAGGSSYATDEEPAGLAEIVKQVASDAEREAGERVRAYETPVTAETLSTPTT